MKSAEVKARTMAADCRRIIALLSIVVSGNHCTRTWLRDFRQAFIAGDLGAWKRCWVTTNATPVDATA
jgi:hypothetical protein